MSNFKELRVLDVSRFVEKKGDFNYLAWAHAADILLQYDPMATWEHQKPEVFNDTLMVFCTVHAFGKSMTMQLPVMNYRMQAIKNPNATEVNNAMQRCLAKCIALFGIGLHLFQGEDLVDLDPLELIKNVYKAQGIEGARAVYNKMDGDARKKCQSFIEEIRESKDGTEK